MTVTTYIIQSSEFSYGYWSEWTCMSPQYQTLAEARRHYDEWTTSRYIPECIRLVRVTTRWEPIPGVRMAYNTSTLVHVYAAKRLRCRAPVCRATKRNGVPSGRRR